MTRLYTLSHSASEQSAPLGLELFSNLCTVVRAIHILNSAQIIQSSHPTPYLQPTTVDLFHLSVPSVHLPFFQLHSLNKPSLRESHSLRIPETVANKRVFRLCRSAHCILTRVVFHPISRVMAQIAPSTYTALIYKPSFVIHIVLKHS